MTIEQAKKAAFLLEEIEKIKSMKDQIDKCPFHKIIFVNSGTESVLTGEMLVESIRKYSINELESKLNAIEQLLTRM